jgi:hypothetical protein
MRKTVLIAALTIGFSMIPFLIHAEVYKWIDDKGTIHFTDDRSNVPEKYLPVAETQPFPKESSLPGVKEKSAPAFAPKSSEPLEQEIARLFSGLINGVDGSGRSITVTGEGKEMVFTVSEDTRITTDYGKNVSFSELKNGSPVTVEYIEKDGDHQARSVKVSFLLAGTTNVVEDDKAGKPNPGPGQLENPGKTQEGVWGDQKTHQTIQDGTPTGKPTKPPQFKLPKKSSK